MTKKNTHGGARKGAGRKKDKNNLVRLQCSIPQEALDMLKGQAKFYEYATLGMYLWSLARMHNLNWMHEPDMEQKDKEQAAKKQFRTPGEPSAEEYDSA